MNNDNIQMSMTIKLTEIKEGTNEENNSIVNNPRTEPITNDSNTNFDVVNDQSIDIPIVNHPEQHSTFKSNFDYDPKLN